jgi:hypothetical protein
LAAVVVCTVAFVLPLVAQPALAADPAQPWIGNSSAESFGPVGMEQGAYSTWTFGTKGGTNASEEVTMTIPDYPGLSVAPIDSFCSAVARSVRCEGPVDSGLFSGQATITIDASSPLGYAGEVTVSTPDGGEVKSPVWVVSRAKGADLEAGAADVTGNMGDTVTLAITVTNHGPSPEPGWAIADLRAYGTVLVGQHGCDAQSAFGGSQVQCAHRAYMAVGAQITVTFDLKIVAATIPPQPLSGFSMLIPFNDPNSSNLNLYFHIHVGPVAGGGSEAGRPGSGNATGIGPVAPPSPSDPAPSSSDPSIPLPSMTVDPIEPGNAPAELASNQQPASSRWFLVAGTGIALLLGFAAISVLRLRRRSALPPPATVDVISTDAPPGEPTQ